MSASKSELWDQLAKAVKILDETFKYAGQNATNFLGLVDTLQQAYEGDHIGTTNSALTSLRSQLNSVCGNTDALNTLLIELAKIGYNSLSTTATLALDDIAKGMDGASETVKNRGWGYGASTAGGSNVGTGLLYRLVTDKYNNVIEAGSFSGGVVKAEITSDKNTGTESGNEQCVLYGSGIMPTDNIYLGTAPSGSIILTAKRAQDGMLANGNLATYTDTGTDVSFSSWTADNTTKATYLTYDTVTYFRKQDLTTAGVTAKFLNNNALTQYITSATSRFNTALPTFLIVRFYRYSSCDGTLTIRLGSKTTTVTLASAPAATWTDVALGATGEDGWYDNFKEDSSGLGVRIKIELTSRTTGELGIGEILLIQPTIYDGKYYVLTAGVTDFVKGDYFTLTDTVSNTGRIQTTIARLYRKHLPHTSGSPTYADA